MDSLIMAAEDLTAFVGYLGESFGLGLAVGFIFFLSGYSVWFLLDVFRGGL